MNNNKPLTAKERGDLSEFIQSLIINQVIDDFQGRKGRILSTFRKLKEQQKLTWCFTNTIIKILKNENILLKSGRTATLHFNPQPVSLALDCLNKNLISYNSSVCTVKPLHFTPTQLSCVVCSKNFSNYATWVIHDKIHADMFSTNGLIRSERKFSLSFNVNMGHEVKNITSHPIEVQGIFMGTSFLRNNLLPVKTILQPGCKIVLKILACKYWQETKSLVIYSDDASYKFFECFVLKPFENVFYDLKIFGGLKFNCIYQFPVRQDVRRIFQFNVSFHATLNQSQRDLVKFLNKIKNSSPDEMLNADNYVELLRVMVELEELTCEKELAKYNMFNAMLIKKNNFFHVPIKNLSEDSVLENALCCVLPMDQLKAENPNWQCGVVVEVLRDGILIKLTGRFDESKKKKYRIKFLLNRMEIIQQHNALRIAENLKSFFFPTTVAVKEIEKREESFVWVNTNIKTNEMQKAAVINIVNQSSGSAPYIIFGPPGTGKTTTIVEAICQILLLDPNRKILVTTASNAACNEVAIRLLGANVFNKDDICRLFAASYEKDLDTIDEDLFDVSNFHNGYHYIPNFEKLYKYKVIFATMSMCGRLVQAKINTSHFDYIFIDEACCEKESRTLIPIAGLVSDNDKINATIVLSGDPHQLGPIIKSSTVQSLNAGVSMMERMMKLPLYQKKDGKYNNSLITKLVENFRTHPALLLFSNHHFYENDLIAQNLMGVNDWAIDSNIISNRKFPFICHNIEGSEQRDGSSPSFFNSPEMNAALAYCDELLNNGLKGRPIQQSDIGIISPYKKQCLTISKALAEKNLSDIEVGSVESFQGREKQIIILTTVRVGSVGFLENPKRLNVAVTRAKSLLILICNVDTLVQNPLWKSLIAYCTRHRSINKTLLNLECEAFAGEKMFAKTKRQRQRKRVDISKDTNQSDNCKSGEDQPNQKPETLSVTESAVNRSIGQLTEQLHNLDELKRLQDSHNQDIDESDVLSGAIKILKELKIKNLNDNPKTDEVTDDLINDSY